MESKSKVFGHPTHPILIALPLGLFTASLLFDGLSKIRKNALDAKISRALIGVGVVSGLAAAVPGLIDYIAIPSNTRAKRVGLVHAIGNVIMLGLFASSWKKRGPDDEQPSNAALALSVSAATLMSLTGWLGGELVYRLGIGVDDGANDEGRPSILSKKP